MTGEAVDCPDVFGRFRAFRDTSATSLDLGSDDPEDGLTVVFRLGE